MGGILYGLVKNYVIALIVWLLRLTKKPVTDNLTGFNNIAIQGTPQMTAHKEAISLSRVHSCYSYYNLPLF